MVNFVKGDLLDSNCDYICHQVNCQGRMGSGIAKQIKEKWPTVYEQYMAGFKARQDKIDRLSGEFAAQIDVSETLLGHLQIVPVEPGRSVINMFSQQYYGYDGKKYTSYDAFWECLNGVRHSVPKGSRIGFPYKIGCGLGGANWIVIQTMIVEVLGKDFDVYIYALEGA